MEIYGSPFILQSFDTNRIVVSEIPRFIIFNQPAEFTIDALKAGEGQLEVAINNGQVPNKVKPLGKSKFHFTFLPTSNNLHRLSVKFNGRDIPGKQKLIFTNDRSILNNFQAFQKNAMLLPLMISKFMDPVLVRFYLVLKLGSRLIQLMVVHRISM